MFSAIENFINELRISIAGLEPDIIFFGVVGLNLLLGIIVLIVSACSYRKTIKKTKTALATETAYSGNPLVDLIPRGTYVLSALAIFFFAAFALLYVDATIPFLGLIVFELFNIISRLVYRGKQKKAKKLFEVYKAETPEAAAPEKTPEKVFEEKPKPEEKHHEPIPETKHAAKEDQKRETPPVIVAPVFTPPEQTQPITREPVQEKQPEPMKTVTPEPKTVTPPPVSQPEPRTAAKPAEEKKPESTSYEPYESRRAAQPEYNIERAPTYSVPRPSVEPKPAPEQKPTAAPKAEPEVTAKPHADSGKPMIDDIEARINQIKKEGATKQTMTELIYIIQKEREKNENKSPEQRQRLSEALSDLLKAMNKSN